MPGFLPNYKGDRYTFASRKEETRALNQAYFKSLNTSKLRTAPQTELQNEIVITLNSNPTTLAKHTINRNNANTKKPVIEFARYPTYSITLLPDDSEINSESSYKLGKLDLSSDDPSQTYMGEATKAIALALIRSNPDFIGPELIIDFDTNYSKQYFSKDSEPLEWH